MKEEKLKLIQKELNKLITFEQGKGILDNTFFGDYQGYKILLTYCKDYSTVWIGRFQGLNYDLAINFDECRVKVEHGQVRFIGTESSVFIGKWRND